MSVEDTPLIEWSGPAWRVHGQRYEANDPGGSLCRSGRFHRAPDRFDAYDCWPALYLSLAPEVSLAEIIRNTDPAIMPKLNTYRITELRIRLQAVFDLRNPEDLDLTALLSSHDYSTSQGLAHNARAAGAEAILVPSATRLGDNLVIFPDQLQPDSRMEIVSSRDPVLYVDRR